MFGKSKRRQQVEQEIERLRWARNILVAGFVEFKDDATDVGLLRRLESMLRLERGITNTIGSLAVNSVPDAEEHALLARKEVNYLKRSIWPSRELAESIPQPAPIY